MSTEPEPDRLVSYEGRQVTYREARQWVLLLNHAGAVATYVARPECWPGYVAWLEQHEPGLDAAVGSELARKAAELDARHLCDMACIAEESLQKAAGTGEQ